MTMEVRAISAIPSFGSITVPKKVAIPNEKTTLDLKSATDDVVSLSIKNETEVSKTVAPKSQIVRPFLSITARK